MPQLATWRVVKVEVCPNMAHHHTSTNHNSPCDKLWHKVVHFYVSIALLFIIIPSNFLSCLDFQKKGNLPHNFSFSTLSISQYAKCLCFTSLIFTLTTSDYQQLVLYHSQYSMLFVIMLSLICKRILTQRIQSIINMIYHQLRLLSPYTDW